MLQTSIRLRILLIIYNARKLDIDHYPNKCLQSQYPNKFYVVNNRALCIL